MRIFRDVLSYVLALWTHWQVLLTGGSIIAVVSIWALATGNALPFNLGWLILGLTFVAASFLAWRSERDKSHANYLRAEEAKAPNLTPAEKHQFALAKEALARIGLDGVTVLRHLNGVGSMTFGSMAPALPAGMTRDSTKEILDACWQKYGLVVRNESHQGIRPHYTYKISPGMQKALDELLFPDGSTL